MMKGKQSLERNAPLPHRWGKCEAMLIFVVMLCCTCSYQVSAKKKKYKKKYGYNNRQKETYIDATLNTIKEKKAYLDNNFTENVTNERKKDLKEFNTIRDSYEMTKASVSPNNPDSSKIYTSLYRTMLAEMDYTNKQSETEIGAKQTFLVENLFSMVKELARMEETALMLPGREERRTYQGTIKEMIKDAEEEVLSLQGNFKSPFCCIVDNLKHKMEDPKNIEAFNNVVEFELNHILLELNNNIIANGTDLVQQDWLHGFRSYGGSYGDGGSYGGSYGGNHKDIINRLFQDQEDSHGVLSSFSTYTRKNRLAMKIETTFTCGSYCPSPKTCETKQNEAKRFGSKNVEQICTTPHPGMITERVTNQMNNRIQEFFLYQLPKAIDEGVGQSVQVSCTPCGEGNLDNGFKPYVDPKTFTGLAQFLLAVEALLDSEYLLLQKFHQECFEAKRSMVKQYDQEALNYTTCVGDVNDFYVVKIRGKDSEDNDIHLLQPDYDAWELALTECSMSFSQAIMVINGALMDSIDELQFKFDSQMEDLKEQHTRLFEGLHYFIKVKAQKGRDELLQVLEQKEKEELDAKQRIKARQASLAMEVAQKIVCDIDGITEKPPLKKKELELLEFFFFLAMDASFRDADIDLAMVEVAVDQVCSVDKLTAVEGKCKTVQNGLSPKKGGQRHLRSLQTARTEITRRTRLRLSSTFRCRTCTARALRSNWRQLETADLLSSGIDKDMHGVVDYHRILMDTEESVLKKAESADFFVKFVNYKFAYFLNKGFTYRLEEGMNAFIVQCSIEE
eukprot:scaffold8153_cov41-Attheya_sp.AAC.3